MTYKIQSVLNVRKGILTLLPCRGLKAHLLSFSKQRGTGIRSQPDDETIFHGNGRDDPGFTIGFEDFPRSQILSTQAGACTIIFPENPGRLYFNRCILNNSYLSSSIPVEKYIRKTGGLR